MKAHSKSTFHILMLLALGVSLVGASLTVTPARATGSTIIVSTTDDELNNDGDCSLREAIQSANDNSDADQCGDATGADTITVPPGTYTLTIAGTGEFANQTGSLDILSDLTINGGGANSTIIRAGATPGSGVDRVFLVDSFTVNISGVTIANGNCPSCIAGGIWNSGGTLTVANSVFADNITSAIDNESSGAVTIINSTFSGNSAPYGGGVMNGGGTLTVTNSSFSGNTASIDGGGLYNDSGTATVRNSTFSGNSAAGVGGAMGNNAVLNLANTILANSTSGADCYNNTGDSLTTDNHNLIETNSASGHRCGSPAVSADPVLGPLGNNGGQTPTFQLLNTSPAINAGDDAVCAASPVSGLDQRGVARPQGAACDIGSYEVAPTQSGPTYTVNTPNDTYDGLCDIGGVGVVNQDCSLRDAITAANQAAGADTITVPGGTYTLAITGILEDGNATGDLDILDDLTINGAGASTTILRAGTAGYPDTPDGLDRVLHVAPGKALNLSGVTVANGHCSGTCSGGGIKNEGTLNVTDSAFSGNTADDDAADRGGGIFNASTRVLTITKSTFLNNNAGGGGLGGGGVWNQQGTVTLTNSTFSGNASSAVANFQGTLTVLNSTFSGNSGAPAADIYSGDIAGAVLNLSNTILANSNPGANCFNDDGTIGTNVHNLIEDWAAGAKACGAPTLTGDPNLAGALALNGGATPNFALQAGSSAINAGDDAACSAAPVNGLDQRGVSRPQGVHCDIGAYERGAGAFADVPVPGKEWMQPWIDAFYAHGVTTGCGGGNYCPENNVTRAEMAVFVLRALHGGAYIPPAASHFFSDVPVAGKEWMEPWIDEYYREGMTTGCGGGNYCPENNVTRAEMAVFVLRSLHGGGYTPPALSHFFSDMPVAGKEWMEPWVDEFKREGVTTGCGGGNYCPENNVTRAEMAVFIGRAYHFYP